nr:Defensin-like protein [Ipomoea batatas]
MASIKLSTVIPLLLLLLLPSFDEKMRVEGRLCESQSHKFKGECWSDTNCASVCLSEGFTGGHCRGFRLRCFCTRECGHD